MIRTRIVMRGGDHTITDGWRGQDDLVWAVSTRGIQPRQNIRPSWLLSMVEQGNTNVHGDCPWAAVVDSQRPQSQNTLTLSRNKSLSLSLNLSLNLPLNLSLTLYLNLSLSLIYIYTHLLELGHTGSCICHWRVLVME